MSASRSKKVFIDTNIWVYQIDRDQSKKSQEIVQFLQELSKTHKTVVSTQVLNEFFVVATRKLGIDPRDAKILVEGLQVAEVVVVDAEHIHAAIDLCTLKRFSYWDALMVSAARSAGCELLVSEDLDHGQVIDGIEILSPFKMRALKRELKGKKN